MARIRTIKPEFPQSESVGRLSRDSRLLFIQLWTLADDSGRARAASRMLASLLYPYDDDAPTLIDVWLDELETENLIRRYEADGSVYLEIINWLKHQKIDKPTASRLPEFREGSRQFAKAREASTTDLGPRTLDMDLGPWTLDRPRKRASRLPEGWIPSEAGGRFAIERGLSEQEANTELEKFTNYWTAKGGQQAAKMDWEATWRNWILTAVERKGKPNGHGKQSLSDRARELAEQVRQQERARGIG